MAKFALVVGVANYTAGLGCLPPARNDAEAVYKVLKDDGYVLPAPLLDPTTAEFQTAFEEAIDRAREKEDIFLFYYSGHGLTTPTRDFYLTSTNSKVTDKRKFTHSTVISYKGFLSPVLKTCSAGSKVVIIDACHSGAIISTEKDVDSDAPIRELLHCGAAILTSCGSYEQAHTEEDAEGLSIYTRFLLDGIRSGDADENGDGLITSDELHQYIKRRIESHPEYKGRMHPKSDFDDNGHRVVIVTSKKNLERKYKEIIERFVSQGLASDAVVKLQTAREGFIESLGVESKIEVERAVLEQRLSAESEYCEQVRAELGKGFEFDTRVKARLKKEASRLALSSYAASELERRERITFKTRMVSSFSESVKLLCRKHTVAEVRKLLRALSEKHGIDYATSVAETEELLLEWEQREWEYLELFYEQAKNDGVNLSHASRAELSARAEELEFEPVKVKKVEGQSQEGLKVELEHGFKSEVQRHLLLFGSVRATNQVDKLKHKFGIEDQRASFIANPLIDDVVHGEQEFEKSFRKFIESLDEFDAEKVDVKVMELSSLKGIPLTRAVEISKPYLSDTTQRMEMRLREELESLSEDDLLKNRPKLDALRNKYRVPRERFGDFVQQFLDSQEKNSGVFESRVMDCLRSEGNEKQVAKLVERLTADLRLPAAHAGKLLARAYSAIENEDLERLRIEVESLLEEVCVREARVAIERLRFKYSRIAESQFSYFIQPILHKYEMQESLLRTVFLEIVSEDGILFSISNQSRWLQEAEKVSVSASRLGSLKTNFELECRVDLDRLFKSALCKLDRSISPQEFEKQIELTARKFGVLEGQIGELISQVEDSKAKADAVYQQAFRKLALQIGPNLDADAQARLTNLRKELFLSDAYAMNLEHQALSGLKEQFLTRYSEELDCLHRQLIVSQVIERYNALRDHWHFARNEVMHIEDQKASFWKDAERDYLNAFKRAVFIEGIEVSSAARAVLNEFGKMKQIEENKARSLEKQFLSEPKDIELLYLQKLINQFVENCDASSIDRAKQFGFNNLMLNKQQVDTIVSDALKQVQDRELEYSKLVRTSFSKSSVLSVSARKMLDRVASELQVSRQKQEIIERQVMAEGHHVGQLGLIGKSGFRMTVLMVCIPILFVFLCRVNPLSYFEALIFQKGEIKADSKTSGSEVSRTAGDASSSSDKMKTSPVETMNFAPPSFVHQTINEVTHNGGKPHSADILMGIDTKTPPRSAWILAGSYGRSIEKTLTTEPSWKRIIENGKWTSEKNVEVVVGNPSRYLAKGDIVEISISSGKVDYLWLFSEPCLRDQARKVLSYIARNGREFKVLDTKVVDEDSKSTSVWLKVEPANKKSSFELKER